MQVYYLLVSLAEEAEIIVFYLVEQQRNTNDSTMAVYKVISGHYHENSVASGIVCSRNLFNRDNVVQQKIYNNFEPYCNF